MIEGYRNRKEAVELTQEEVTELRCRGIGLDDIERINNLMLIRRTTLKEFEEEEEEAIEDYLGLKL